MNKTLIAGACFVKTHQRRDITKLWAKLNAHLNPDCDILLVDSASPISPSNFLDWGKHVVWHVENDSDIPSDARERQDYSRFIVRFNDDLGHRAGALRDIPMCLRMAVEMGYENVALIEPDLLFSQPVTPIFEKMKKANVKAAAPLDMAYQFVEMGLMFFDVRYLRETNFPTRCVCDETEYSKTREWPEVTYEKLLGDDLWILPLRGLRNDGARLNWKNFDSKSFPYGISYLTHCNEFGLDHKFLRFNGITLPDEKESAA